MKKLLVILLLSLSGLSEAQTPLPLSMEGMYRCKINGQYPTGSQTSKGYKYFRRSLTDSLKINISTDSSFSSFSTCSIDSIPSNSFSYYKSSRGPYNGYPFSSTSVHGRYYITLDSIYYVTTTSSAPPWHQNSTTCACNKEYPIGIKENYLENLKIFPNPATNYIRILELPEKANYFISTINGTQIQEGVLNQKGSIIYLNEIESGIYFLKIQNDSESNTFKIIKN